MKPNTNNTKQKKQDTSTRSESTSEKKDKPNIMGWNPSKTVDSQEDSSERFTEHCPECEGEVKPGDHKGERECIDCGLIMEDGDTIDHGKEWRNFGSDGQDKSRVGQASTHTRHDKGLTTEISWQDRDAYGKSLNSHQRRKFSRLRKHQRQSQFNSTREQNLATGLGEIDRMGSALNFPKKTRETASMIFKQAHNEDLLIGRSIEGMTSASLYAAARMEGNPRSLTEIANVSRVEQKRVRKAYSHINTNLRLGIGPTDPKKYVSRIATKVNNEYDDKHVTTETVTIAKRVVDRIINNNIDNGKSPIGIAAGSLYYAGWITNNRITQSELSQASNVTEVTIRERYEDIIEHGSDEWFLDP